MVLERETVKELALRLGFDAVGVAPAALLSGEVGYLKAWVEAGKQGSMAYMERNMEVRENPGRLVPGVRSVIVTLTNYYSSCRQSEDVPRIALYARGKDYHEVIKKRLWLLLDSLCSLAPEVRGRCFVDSAPVLEHAWARRAGLGWQGKNTLLIRKGLGSYCFIGVLMVTAEFDAYDQPFTASYCGTCTRCVEACPTGALTAGEVDARKCISYQTIENKGEYPEALKRLAGNRIFGCDACQEVCPWNRHVADHHIPDFLPSPDVMALTAKDWETMSPGRFKALFQNTPLERTGLKRLKRNL